MGRKVSTAKRLHFQSLHYSGGDESQGVLVRQVCFPYDYSSDDKLGGQYVDRIRQHNPDAMNRVKDLVGTNEGGWTEWIKNCSEEDALLFAKAIFDNDEITGVRFVYYFNVATGYDCPRIDYFIKSKDSKTKVYSEQNAPNVTGLDINEMSSMKLW